MTDVPESGVGKHEQCLETPKESFVFDKRRGGGGVHVGFIYEGRDGVVLRRSVDCSDADEDGGKVERDDDVFYILRVWAILFASVLEPGG